MTKEDKTLGKALDIALSLDSIKPTLDRCVETGIQMAAWKEQQMIEKFTKFLETNSHIENNRYLCIDSNKDIRFASEFIEYFKNYMTND